MDCCGSALTVKLRQQDTRFWSAVKCITLHPFSLAACKLLNKMKKLNMFRHRRWRHPNKSWNQGRCLGKWKPTDMHASRAAAHINVLRKIGWSFLLQSQLDIPFKVKAGHIGETIALSFFCIQADRVEFVTMPVSLVGKKGRLELKIPWKNLYTQSVEATLEGVFLLIVPTASKMTFVSECKNWWPLTLLNVPFREVSAGKTQPFW